jgi:stage III sporulation protein AH
MEDNMNKQNLWFISLFSIILILCIYYISIPNNLLDNIEPTIDETSETTVNASESSTLVALRVENDETVLNQISNLQTTILDPNKTAEEKSTAYEELKNVNYNRGKEETLEKLIKEEFNYEAYVNINNDQVSIVINASDHNKEIANNIIKRVQKEFDAKKYITVKFQ